MNGILQASPKLTTSNDPIPAVIDKVNIEFSYIALNDPKRQERCWQVVLKQKCGLDLLKASIVYFKYFAKLGEVQLKCKANSKLTLPREVFEAFKKDSGTFGSMIEEMGESDAYLPFYKEELEAILSILYPDFFTSKVKVDLLKLIEAVNYLDLPKLLKRLVQDLQDKIRVFSFVNYLEAHQLYASLQRSKVYTQPFIKDVMQNEFAEYFGEYLLKHPEDPNIDKYEALAFEKDISDEMLAKLSNAVRLSYLRIEKGFKISRWPEGFLSLKVLILREYPLRIEVFPENLKSLTISYVDPHASDLLPLPSWVILKGYPSQLEQLSLACHFKRVDLMHVPNTVKELTLMGDIFISETFIPMNLSLLAVSMPLKVKRLAPTLTVLRMDSHNNEIPLEELKNLPLIELKLPPVSPYEPNLIDYIPKTVRKLEIFLGGLTDEQIARLPPNLESFSLIGDIRGDFLSLFRNLKELRLAHSHMIKDEDLKRLDRNLESLILSYCSGITDEGMRYLPEGLVSLRLESIRRLTNRAVALIPRAIRTLALVNIQVTRTCFAFIPRSVEELTLYCEDFGASTYGELPASLRKLLILKKTSISLVPKFVKVKDF